MFARQEDDDSIWMLTATTPTWVRIDGMTVPAHASSHQDGGSDEIAIATPTSAGIPKADAFGYLAPGWVSRSNVITVALAGTADYVGATGALESAMATANAAATSTDPYIVRVAPGVYTASPFTVGPYVCLEGDGIFQTQIETNDNSNHFITASPGGMLRNCAITGPTGTGYAAINHETAGTTPFHIHFVVIRAGYYGVWAHAAASRNVVHAFFVGNWYKGSRIENFMRATDFGNVTAVMSNFMNGVTSACGTGFYVSGGSAEMTLDYCAHRSAGSDHAIAVDAGAKVRALAFAFSRALHGICVLGGTNSRVFAAGCTMRRDFDSKTISAFADYSGTVPGTTKVTTSAAHTMITGAFAIIAGTTSYDGQHEITYISTTEFYIVVAFVADEAPATMTVGAIQGNHIEVAAGCVSATVEYSGTIDKNRVLDDGTTTRLPIVASDLTPGEEGIYIRGELWNGSGLESVPMGALTRATASTGWDSGGEVTRAGGLDLDVTAGIGFVNTGTGVVRVTWDADTVTLTDDATNWVYVDSNEVVTASTTKPSEESTVLLAQARASSGSVTWLATTPVEIAQPVVRIHEWIENAVGNLWGDGLAVTDAGALAFDVAAGTYFQAALELDTTAQVPATFTAWYNGDTPVTGQTALDDAQYDNAGTLTAIPATEYVKHAIWAVQGGDGTEIHVVYGQETFVDQATAEAGAMPVAPAWFEYSGIPLYGVVILENADTIASLVDVRPQVGQSGPGTTAVTDHGALTGLGDDDHAQYLLLGGGAARNALTGTLDASAGEAVLPVSAAPAQTTDGQVKWDSVLKRITVGNGVARETFPALGATAPANVTKAAALVGSSTESARADHKHNITTAAAGTLTASTSNAEGSATSLARSDHSHAITTGAPGATSVATAAATGSSASLARADHVHQSNTAPSSVGSANSIGTSGEPARADHVHNAPGRVVQSFTSTASTSGPTTTSTTFAAAIPEMTTSFTPLSASNNIKVDFSGYFTHGTNNASTRIALFVDGVAVTGAERRLQVGTSAPREVTLALSWDMTLSVAAHTIEIRWSTSSGTLTGNGLNRGLRIEEISA
jgi:hypothetical protein